MYSSLNKIGMNQSKRMIWAGNVARTDKMRIARMKPLGRQRRRWGITLEWILEKEDGVVWTG